MSFILKMLRRLIAMIFGVALVAALVVGGIFVYSGHSQYEKLVAEKPVAQAMGEVQAKSTYTPLENIPDIYKNAVIAIEDHRFYEHHGLDLIATLRATVCNIRAGELDEGGSTISQQLAKNLYTGAEKTLSRKITEFFIARDFEKNYTKDQILEAYINSIYYGDGYYDIASASYGYFGVPPTYLGNGQATMLAGVPNAPSVYAPTVNYDLARQRQRQVLNAMVKYDYLTQDEADAIYAQG
ncbi:MAG: biosynthetic peptidoglycan transglycosylase [Peptococcaceae bacterium]|nr:biosynthetic peptidoglycan transglycosylase [Peptococcaceae bacterium]